MDLRAIQVVKYVKLGNQLTMWSGRCVLDGTQASGMRNWADVATFTEPGSTGGSQVWGRRT